MFSMKIGLAAFDQPGQLNRPFNYPIRYIYILPSLESPRLEERTIGPNWLALHAMFHLLFNFVRTMERVRSHGDAFRIDPVLLADEHGMEQYSIRNKSLRSSRYPSCKLDSFPCSSLKSNRSISIFTTSLLVRRRSSLHDPRRRIDFVLFVSFWHVSPILLC